MPHHFPNGLPAVLPTTIARIERRLPAPGEIVVRMGSRVEPDDLIGRCAVQSEPVLLDVAGALRIEPRDIRRRLRHKPGDRVAFHDLLARRHGRTMLAPFPGTLAAVDEATGFIVLMPDPVPASISAAIRGSVVDLQPNYSATIETSAAVVQGAVGFGGEQWGMLQILAADPSTIITADMIDAQSAFSLVVGGAGITVEALRRAQKEQVKGIIVGGVDAGELSEYWGPRFDGNWLELLRIGAMPPVVEEGPTLLITEGFGLHAMSRPIFELLAQFDRQEAHLDGTSRLEPPARTPRLVIPVDRLSRAASAPFSAQELRRGAMVRLIDEAHLGLIGRIESRNPHGRLPSGARVPVATVQIGEFEWIMLPELALEVME
jgi:hypothetical protein